MYRYLIRHSSSLLTQKVRIAVCIFYITLGIALFGQTSTAANDTWTSPETAEPVEATNGRVTLDLNLNQQRPMLSLPDQIQGTSDLYVAYPMGQLRFPLFQSLEFNGRSNRYTVQVLSKANKLAQTIEFKETDTPGKYVAAQTLGLYLADNKGVKALRTSEGTEYTFVRFNDGVTRCVRVKTAAGSIISLIYAKDYLIHGLVDTAGRTISFNYEDHQVASVTQTWKANSVTVSQTWPVGRQRNQVKLAHAGSSRVSSSPAVIAGRSGKPIPNNAVTPRYTGVMASNDRQLATIFGGPGAVAAANGYEPVALGPQYPFYRGDLIANGRLIRGHLSYAMHLYGNAEGTGVSSVYVPGGFTTHSSGPGPTDAAVTFYYPRLGNLTDVTLAVFHVANFGITYEGGSVRIGTLGGPGGSNAAYRHSHIEFYRGNTGLPASSARERLRIDPASVFSSNSMAATRTRSTTARRSE